MRKLIISLLSVGLLFNISCSDWLDVQPNSQIKDSELFSTEAGFKEALAGIYTILTAADLYSKELRFGMMGVLAQEWTSYPIAYNDDGAYNYDGTNPTTRIDNVWSNMYYAISNVNKLLESIDEAKHLFTGDNFDIIKGEALALRGYLHFDLLRCFGATYAINPYQDAIPYVTAYTSQQTTQYTVFEVLNSIVIDLETAALYLEADPIYTGQVITELDDNGYLMNRQLHLNYYAVKGTLARVYLYMEEYDLAEECALEVINSNKFTWSKSSDMSAGIDYTGASEHIFGLDVTYLTTISQEHLSQEGSSIFALSADVLSSYYESITDDYRYLYLFTSGTNTSVNTRYLAKYNETESTDNYYANKMVMLKLAEMYYILAECQYYMEESSLSALNAVREARGVTALNREPADFLSTLVTEFRKEFIGEGQLFYLYKRLNLENIENTDLNLVDLKAYIFPLPQAEYDAANRNSNR